MTADRNFTHAVLGAGVAGLTAAHHFSQEKGARVLVVEDRQVAGGNQLNVDIGPYTFDIGAFYFIQDTPFFKMFPEVEQTCVSVPIGVERVTPRGTVQAYPFDFRAEIAKQSPLFWSRAGLSILRAKAGGVTAESAEDYARYHMGGFLYRELGLDVYMHRFYACPPDEIEYAFAESRMRMLAQLSSAAFFWQKVRQRLRRERGTNPTSFRTLVRPQAGFASMYAPAVKRLEQSGVHVLLAAECERINRTGDSWELICNGARYRVRELASAIPIRRLARLLNVQLNDELRSSRLHTLFVSFSGKRGFRAPILYNFNRLGAWKRATVHSDYYGTRGGREYLNVEFPEVDSSSRDSESLFADFRHSTQSHDLFRGDLTLEGNHVLSEAYPIYTHGATAAKAKVLRQLEGLGVRSLGRQGRFDYLPSSSAVVHRVRRVLHEPAPTRPHPAPRDL